MRWDKLLLAEREAEYQILEAQSPEFGAPTLFTDFIPNPGGQTKFFEFAPLQPETLDPTYRWIFGVGGIGSGKSFCGAIWSVSRALMFPNARGLIGANSFSQLAEATLTTLVEVCRTFNVPLEPYRDKIEENAMAIANCRYCYIGEKRAFAFVKSMHAFEGKTQAGRGMQIRWAWLDEGAYSSEQAFQTLDGRLGRGPGKLKGQGVVTTSPNGFNWIYDRAGAPDRTPAQERTYLAISIPTTENVKHLGQEYIDSLETNYGDELADQELRGMFVNTKVGRCYKYFIRASHALEPPDNELLAYDPKLPLCISFDFNRDPACCVLGQVRRNELHIFREFFITSSDTIELSEAVAAWIKLVNHQSDIKLYGDATGRIKTANSRFSNWDIVNNTLKDNGIKFARCYKDSNPPVEFRVNSVNVLLKNDRLYVDRVGCKELTKDFENVVWKGDQIDKTSDLARTHLSDAAGYLVYELFPYRTPTLRNGERPAGLAV